MEMDADITKMEPGSAKPDGPTGGGLIWKMVLSLNPPMIPAYWLLREILQIPLPRKEKATL